jgi:stage III sporulation protein AD
MTELIKMAFLGIAGVLLALQFKSVKAEYAIYVGLAVSLIIFGFLLRQVEVVIQQFSKMKEYMNGGEEYLGILLKVIGITYISDFSAGICKDAGYQSVAGQIELLGKVSVMFAGIPILFATIEQIQQLL